MMEGSLSDQINATVAMIKKTEERLDAAYSNAKGPITLGDREEMDRWAWEGRTISDETWEIDGLIRALSAQQEYLLYLRDEFQEVE